MGVPLVRNRAAVRGVLAASLTLLLLLASTIGPAGAQAGIIDNIEDVANFVDVVGWYVADGAVDDSQALEALSDRALDGDGRWYFVSLAAPPAEGLPIFADELRRLLPEGTVVVMVPVEVDGETRFDVEMSSDEFTAAEINAGQDAAADRLAGRSGTAADVAGALFDGISEQRGPGLNPLWLVAGVGGVGAAGAGVWALNRRQDEKKRRERDASDIDTARTEIKSQLDAVANYVIGQAEFVELSTNEHARQYYQEATATFDEVDTKLPRATTLLELATLNDDIELARWKMEAAEALIGGREPPEKPTSDAPLACFFDPTHRPGTEVVAISTAAGDKEVRVCPDDAAKLKRGEKPIPRMINVHGERVPAAKAPRSHGGLGMGGIDLFDILLGGLGSGPGRGFPRTQPRRRRQPQPGGFPWDWSPKPTRTARRRPTSRRTRTGFPGSVFGPDSTPRGGSSSRSTTSRRSSRPRRSTRAKGSSRRRF